MGGKGRGQEKEKILAEWNRMEQNLLSVMGSVSQKEQHPNHSFEDCVINTAVMANNANMSTEGKSQYVLKRQETIEYLYFNIIIEI